jgi:hypothetical protein
MVWRLRGWGLRERACCYHVCQRIAGELLEKSHTADVTEFVANYAAHAR